MVYMKFHNILELNCFESRLGDFFFHNYTHTITVCHRNTRITNVVFPVIFFFEVSYSLALAMSFSSITPNTCNFETRIFLPFCYRIPIHGHG